MKRLMLSILFVLLLAGAGWAEGGSETVAGGTYIYAYSSAARGSIIAGDALTAVVATDTVYDRLNEYDDNATATLTFAGYYSVDAGVTFETVTGATDHQLYIKVDGVRVAGGTDEGGAAGNHGSLKVHWEGTIAAGSTVEAEFTSTTNQTYIIGSAYVYPGNTFIRIQRR